MTNFQKIKEMSLEQLTDLLSSTVDCDTCPIEDFCNTHPTFLGCGETIKQWLQEEASDD